MTAQAFSVGDRVEIIGENWRGEEHMIGFTGEVVGVSDQHAACRVKPDGGGLTTFYPLTSLRLLSEPAPLPPTEENRSMLEPPHLFRLRMAMEALTVELRQNNILLASRPAPLTLHGQEREPNEAQARADEKYGQGTQRLHDVYRRTPPQRDM